MPLEIVQMVLAPNPDGRGTVRAEVVGIGGQGDATPLLGQEGKLVLQATGEPIMRDVAWVQYQEGDLDGTIGRVQYHLLKPAE